jgi:hypothetical protein
MGQCRSRSTRPAAHSNFPITVVKSYYNNKPRVGQNSHRQSTLPSFVTPNEPTFTPSVNGRNGWKHDELYEIREEVSMIFVC